MKIGVILPALEKMPTKQLCPEGNFSFALAKELEKLGESIVIYGSYENTGFQSSHFLTQEKALRAKADNSENQSTSRIKYYAQRALTVKAIRDLNEGKLDILHCSHATLMDLSAFTMKPVVCTVHFGLSEQALASLGDIFEAFSGFPNVSFVCVSEHQASRFEQAGIKRNINVIRIGIDVPNLEVEYEKDNFALFLGRMSPEKRPHLAIEIAKKAGLPIILAGPKDEESQADPLYFREYIEPLLIDDSVSYIGPVDFATRDDLLKRTRAVLFTSNGSDALGMCILEANALGTPVYAISGNASDELIRNDLNGFVHQDIDTVACKLKQGAGVESLTINRYAQEHFSMENCATSYLELYKNAIQEIS